MTSRGDGVIAGHARDAAAILAALAADGQALGRAEAAGAAMVGVLRGGGKLLCCGNGGSACDAAHLAEELSGRFRKDRPAIAAVACTDAGHLTCVGNDYGFDKVFSRWIEALGRRGDAAVLVSTSGNSPNVVAAAEAARGRGVMVVGLLGRGGGKVGPLCDHPVIVPGETSERIQEAQKVLIHGWVDLIERGLFLGA